MANPLISVVCLCYNHERFVENALLSVLRQDYSSKEIIVIDDCSTDNSCSIIESILIDYPEVTFIKNKINQGNCKSFNAGLRLASGKYIIDFATDDVVLPGSLASQVRFFEQQSDSVGLIYANARYTFDDSIAGHRTPPLHFGKDSRLTPHTGEVYSIVIQEYFIPTAATVFRKSVMDELGGYDENLAFEDFDIWVRLTRNYEVAYLDEVLVNITKSASSMSSGWYKKGDVQVKSTYQICKKIQRMNRTEEEHEALISRVKYEIRMCFLNGLREDLDLFYSLLRELKGNRLIYVLYALIGKLGIRFKR